MSFKKIALIGVGILLIFGVVFTIIAWVMLRPESSETLDTIEESAETNGVLPSAGGVATADAEDVVSDDTVERPSVVVQVRQTDNAVGIFDVVTQMQYMHSLGALLYLTDARNSLYLFRNGIESEAMSPSRTYDNVWLMDSVTVPGLDRPYVLLNSDDGPPSFVASEGATGQLPDAAQAVFAGSSQFLLADYDEQGRLSVYLRRLTNAYDSSKDVRVYQHRSGSMSAVLLSANDEVAFLQVHDESGAAIAALSLRTGELVRVVESPARVWIAPEGKGLLVKREQSGAVFYDYVQQGGSVVSIGLPPHNELFAWSADGAYLFTLAASESVLETQASQADAIEEAFVSDDPGAVEPFVPLLGDQLWVLDLEAGREAQVTTLDEPVFADEFFYDDVRRQLVYRDPQLQAIIIIPDVEPTN